MPVVGPRFLIEAGFIIAVAVIAGIERLGTWWIIVWVGTAWVIVALVEIGIWLRHAVLRPRQASRPAEPQVATAPLQTHAPPVVRPEPRGEPRIPATPQPQPQPQPQPEREPKPEPARLVAVPPEPEPVPVPQSEPPPQPEPERVVAFLPVNDGPREWNLWELERAARDHADADVARVEERSFLLMYLRDFAGPDGSLPTDFDGLVRDAFGDVLHTVAT